MPKKTYTVKEVARLLGFSTNTVYKYLDEGKIKATRFGKEGRFRVPGAEVARLLQENKSEPNELSLSIKSVESKSSDGLSFLDEKTAGAPSLFDWFICFLSIALGFSQVVFPAYSVSSVVVRFLPLIQVLQGLLFVAGFGLIAFDVLNLNKNKWHNILHVVTGLLYFILAVLFIVVGVIPNAIGYMSVAAIIGLTAFYKPNGAVRFVLFLIFIMFLIGVGATVWPTGFFQELVVGPQSVNRPLFYVVWTAGMILLLWLGMKVAKGSSKALNLISILVAIFSLIFSVLAFTHGYWGRAIYTVVLGSFAVIFPFSAHFESFTLKSRTELVGSFLWLLGLFFVGSIVLYFVYHSFQSYILSELDNRVNTANDLLTSYIRGNESKVLVFAESPQLAEIVKNNPSTNNPTMDAYLKQLYLSSNGTLRRVVLTNKDGVIVDTYPYNLSSQGVNISSRDYFKLVKPGEGAYLTGIVQPSSPGISPAILVSVAIADAKGNFLGVLTGSTDIRELQKLIDQVKFGQNGSFIVADSQKNYIIPPLNAKVLDKAGSHALVSMAVDGGTGVKTGYDDQGALSFSVYKRIDAFGWGIVAQQPFNEAFKAYSIVGFVTFLVFIMSGIGSLILVIYLRRNNKKINI